MKWSLGGRSELHDAGRGEWRASEISPLCACGAFSGNEWEEIMGGDRAI